jgi:hypothetical protein
VKNRLRALGACSLMMAVFLPFDVASGGVRPALASTWASSSRFFGRFGEFRQGRLRERPTGKVSRLARTHAQRVAVSPLILVARGLADDRDLVFQDRPTSRAEELETANACVGFQNSVGDKQLLVHAGNDCERKLACTLDYEVRCEDNHQKETSRVSKRVLFSLAAKGNAELTLSAAACHQGWAIEDLEWTCR